MKTPVIDPTTWMTASGKVLVSSNEQVTVSAGRFPWRLGLRSWITIVSVVPPIGVISTISSMMSGWKTEVLPATWAGAKASPFGDYWPVTAKSTTCPSHCTVIRNTFFLGWLGSAAAAGTRTATIRIPKISAMLRRLCMHAPPYQGRWRSSGLDLPVRVSDGLVSALCAACPRAIGRRRLEKPPLCSDFWPSPDSVACSVGTEKSNMHLRLVGGHTEHPPGLLRCQLRTAAGGGRPQPALR